MFLENYASITRNENKGLDAYAKQHALHSVKKRSKRNLHETLLMLTRPPNVEKNRFFKIWPGYRDGPEKGTFLRYFWLFFIFLLIINSSFQRGHFGKHPEKQRYCRIWKCLFLEVLLGRPNTTKFSSALGRPTKFRTKSSATGPCY